MSPLSNLIEIIRFKNTRKNRFGEVHRNQVMFSLKLPMFILRINMIKCVIIFRKIMLQNYYIHDK